MDLDMMRIGKTIIILPSVWRILLTKRYTALLQNYKDVPNKIIQAIVEANTTRKDYIAAQIIKKIQVSLVYFVS